MDLTQQKLTKQEWEFLEIPVNPQELEILKLIYSSYNNVDYTVNKTKSLLYYLKIKDTDNSFHQFLFKKYFQESLQGIIKKYNIEYNIKKMEKVKKINTANMIRIKNSSSKLDEIKKEIIEFILISLIKTFFKKSLCPMTYYTICDIMKNNIYNVNIYVVNFVKYVLNNYKDKINKRKLKTSF